MHMYSKFIFRIEKEANKQKQQKKTILNEPSCLRTTKALVWNKTKKKWWRKITNNVKVKQISEMCVRRNETALKRYERDTLASRVLKNHTWKVFQYNIAVHSNFVSLFFFFIFISIIISICYDCGFPFLIFFHLES